MLIGGAIVGGALRVEKGDYIIGKETLSPDVSAIIVVHDVTRMEADTKSLSYFLRHLEKHETVYYHVHDSALYSELAVGERVTIQPEGYTMLSSPVQKVAKTIIRHD